MLFSSLTAFYVVRGMYESSSVIGRPDHFLVPLTVAALPAIGMAVAKKQMPSKFYLAGLMFCGAAHLKDRVFNLPTGTGKGVGRPI